MIVKYTEADEYVSLTFLTKKEIKATGGGTAFVFNPKPVTSGE